MGRATPGLPGGGALRDLAEYNGAMSFTDRVWNLGKGIWKVQSSKWAERDPLRPTDTELEQELARTESRLRRQVAVPSPRAQVAASPPPGEAAIPAATAPASPPQPELPQGADEAIIYDGDRAIRKTL